MRTSLELVNDFLAGIRKVGTKDQQLEADEIQRVLQRHFAGGREAVNFAREEKTPAQNEGDNR
jgi:hypothetical protein